MTDELDPQEASTSEQQTGSSVRREPVAGTTEERQEPRGDAAVDAPPSSGDVGDDELEAQAADDFYHDRPAATSARVLDPQGSPEP